jgi:hypothetical protein
MWTFEDCNSTIGFHMNNNVGWCTNHNGDGYGFGMDSGGMHHGDGYGEEDYAFLDPPCGNGVGYDATYGIDGGSNGVGAGC